MANSTLQNNTFSDFYDYIVCINNNTEEFANLNLIKINIIDALSGNSDNNIIQLLQLYKTEFLSFAVFSDFIHKSLYEYKKEIHESYVNTNNVIELCENLKIFDTIDIKTIITTTLDTMNASGNEQVQDTLNTISIDIESKIPYLSELIKNGYIPTDNIVTYELITSQITTFQITVTLSEITFLIEALAALTETNSNIYVNFITAGDKNSHSDNIINILNYKYISNPYIKINITNTQVFT